jgi:hypothetical protein
MWNRKELYFMSEKTTMEKFGGFLGKAKDGIVSFGETVASKSKEMVDVTKLSSKRTQVTGEIDGYYRELGMVVYQQRAIGADAEALFARIAECQEKIQDLTAQIEAAKANRQD